MIDLNLLAMQCATWLAVVKSFLEMLQLVNEAAPVLTVERY